MSLIPKVFRSTDPGAPVLSGSSGSFAALMDAVLVDGYGSGSSAVQPLGWTRAFSDGFKRAYQNNPADGGTGLFWRIDDSNAQYVLNSGFHTMSGIDVGVDVFANISNAWGKSITANNTPRSWVIVGNSRTVYIFIQSGHASVGASFVGHMAGDFECLNKGYAFNFGLTHTEIAAVTTAAGATNLLDSRTNYGAFTAARSYDGGVIGSKMYNRSTLIGGAFAFGGASNNFPYPHPSTGGVLASRVLMNSGGYLFGSPPGLWAPEHNQAFTRFTVLDDLVGLPGRWLVVQALSNQACQGLLSLDRPWDY